MPKKQSLLGNQLPTTQNNYLKEKKEKSETNKGQLSGLTLRSLQHERFSGEGEEDQDLLQKRTVTRTKIWKISRHDDGVSLPWDHYS